MEKISSCRICNSEIKEFFDLGYQPFANSLLKSLDKAEKYYPLSLSWCTNCNLIQLNHTADPKELFNDYVWVTGTSKTAQEYSKNFCEGILSKVKNINYALEIASNDGTFLKPFLDNKISVLGIDPAQNIVDMANKSGIKTVCKFFGEQAARDVVKEYGKPKVVFARNVLPHVANLHDFVAGLNTVLDNDGLLVIEFHYAKPILDDLHYDSIYHEHLCYYTIKSIEKLFNMHDLFIEDIDESPINAGNRIIYIRKKAVASENVIKYREIELNDKVNALERWQDFAKRAQNHKKELVSLLQNLKLKNKKLIGYGASARSSTLLNYCKINTEYLDLIADKNPLKHKKFTAGTHIPIFDPDSALSEKPDIVLILAWNFSEEIIDILQNNYGFFGQSIVPLPQITVKGDKDGA